MKKTTIGLFVIPFIILCVLFIYSTQNQSQDNELGTYQDTKATSKSKNFKLYIDTEFNFQLKYPKILSETDDPANIIDRNGKTIAKEIRFTDKQSETTLLIVYRLPPNSVDRYTTKYSQFNSLTGPYDSNSRSLDLGNENLVLISNKVITKNGKEHVLNPPERILIADFLHQGNKGSIEVQYRFPISKNELPTTQFDQIISSFEFNN